MLIGEGHLLAQELGLEPGEHELSILIGICGVQDEKMRQELFKEILRELLESKDHGRLVAFLGILPAKASRYSTVRLINAMARASFKEKVAIPDQAISTLDDIQRLLDGGKLKPDMMLSHAANADRDQLFLMIPEIVELAGLVCRLAGNESAQVPVWTEMLLAVEKL